MIVDWTLRNIFGQMLKLFIHENESENIVWETAAILSRGKMSLQNAMLTYTVKIFVGLAGAANIVHHQ